MRSLYEKLEEYCSSDYYPYHMPGHKRRLFGEGPQDWIRTDITEIEGFDNLHQPEGILQELQEHTAKLYGAKESFYLVNGSTCGILSSVSAALPEGGHLLIVRNCHKSVYHAAYLRKLTLSYLYPEVIKEYDICEAVTAKQVCQALSEQSNVGAVLIVSPTYEGRIAPVAEIAKIVHEKGIPLIVDEAHGAHLGFQKPWAKNSCQQGADLVIHSVHKTLPAMTQTALLHVNGTLIDRERLRRFLHIYQTSSPSYILMASIDNALRLVESEGSSLFTSFRRNWEAMLARLSSCSCLKFLPRKGEIHDIGKLVISTHETGLSGQQLYDMLLNEYHLQLELAAGQYCLAMFTIGDEAEGFRRLTEALLEIDSRLCCHRKRYETPIVEYGDSDMRHSVPMPLYKAWELPIEKCPIESAVGRMAGEFIMLYPPGIPVLVPGEVITLDCIHRISEWVNGGVMVQGVHNSHTGVILTVLKERL